MPRTGRSAWLTGSSRRFEDETYEVFIDSSLEDGYLTYGEYLHKGETDDEFLLSAHVCHPSLANDNCSGIALLTHLAQRMVGLKTRYSYRFLFAPGTIGAIAWLARNEEAAAASSMGSSSPWWATGAVQPIRKAAAATRSSIARSPTFFATLD